MGVSGGSNIRWGSLLEGLVDHLVDLGEVDGAQFLPDGLQLLAVTALWGLLVGLDCGEAAVELGAVRVDLQFPLQFLAFGSQTLHLRVLAFQLPLQLPVALVQLLQPVPRLSSVHFYGRSSRIVIGLRLPLLEVAARKGGVLGSLRSLLGVAAEASRTASAVEGEMSGVGGCVLEDGLPEAGGAYLGGGVEVGVEAVVLPGEDQLRHA